MFKTAGRIRCLEACRYMTGNTVDGRKGQKSLLRTLIIVAMVLAFVFLISSNAFGEVRSIFSTQEDQSERVLEGVNIQLIKSQCKNNRDNYCSGDVPPQCPDELSESQKWACRKKTGLGNEENPFYCYEIWASKGGGGIGGIPACTGGATS